MGVEERFVDDAERFESFGILRARGRVSKRSCMSSKDRSGMFVVCLRFWRIHSRIIEARGDDVGP